MTPGRKVVLYDGWPLVYAPNSPAALHLLALLACHPQEFTALVGLPGESFHPLPPGVQSHIAATPDTASRHVRWEQRLLPGLAATMRASLVHLTAGAPTLFGRVPTLVSPGGYLSNDQRSTPGLFISQAGPGGGLAERWRAALAQGGLQRAKCLAWPADLPLPVGPAGEYAGPVERLPAVLPPGFKPGGPDETQVELEIPDTYVLYHGPTAPADLRRLLDMWSWAAGSIGEYFPLLVAGADAPARDRLSTLLHEYRLGQTVRCLPPLALPALAAAYRGCSALLHPAPISAWGDPVRMGLACARPVVAVEDVFTNAIAGPAAYLTPPEAGSRAKGAALITVIVEESLASRLAEAARLRAQDWQPEAFARRLAEVYRSII